MSCLLSGARRGVWLVLACVAAACSTRDASSPVANVSVTLSRTQAPPETAVDFTYRFEPLPGPAIDANYRVFVQLRNADGQLIWSDDHDPVVPTTTWKAGQIVEYTRTAFVPRGVAAGELALFVGLYNNDHRLPLKTAESTGQESDRAYRVGAFQVAPDAERVHLIYKTGWYPEEVIAASGESWQWMQQSGVVRFENPKADIVVTLDYSGRPDVFPDGPQTARLSAGDTVLQTWRVDSQDRRLVRIPVSQTVLGTGPMVELTIDVDKTFVPAALPADGKDTRTLGLRIYHVVVDRR